MTCATVQSLTGRALNQLRDPGFIRWPLAELCDYYNDAVRAIILIRPDAGAVTERITAIAGAHQHLPPGTVQLLEITGITDGRALSAASRQELNTSYPHWRQMHGSPERYIYSGQTPREYWLFPAPQQEIMLDAVLVRIPDPVLLTDLNGATPVAPGDAWVNPLLDWMLYRAFSKDADQGAQLQLAMQHYQAFSDQLNLKTRADGVSTPPVPPSADA